MGYAVFGIPTDKVRKCRDRAIAQVQTKKSVTLTDESGTRRVQVTDQTANALIDHLAQSAIAAIKPVVLEQFEHPQFCLDWIELAAKNDAPYRDLRIGEPPLTKKEQRLRDAISKSKQASFDF